MRRSVIRTSLGTVWGTVTRNLKQDERKGYLRKFQPETAAEEAMFSSGYKAGLQSAAYLPPSDMGRFRDSYDAGFQAGESADMANW